MSIIEIVLAIVAILGLASITYFAIHYYLLYKNVEEYAEQMRELEEWERNMRKIEKEIARKFHDGLIKEWEEHDNPKP